MDSTAGQSVGVDAHDPGAAVVEDVDEVVGREPRVDRDENGADLRHRVEGLEVRVRVAGDRGDPVSPAHAEPLQRRRPAVAAVEEGGIAQAEAAVDDGLPIAVQAARAASELHRRERGFHGIASGLRAS